MPMRVFKVKCPKGADKERIRMFELIGFVMLVSAVFVGLLTFAGWAYVKAVEDYEEVSG